MLAWDGRRDEDPNEFRPVGGEGSAVVRADGTVVSANAAAASGFGLSVDELVGSRLTELSFDLLASDGGPLEHADCPVHRVVVTGLGVHDVVVGVRAVGATTWWSVSGHPLVDDDGAVTGVACVLAPVVRADVAGSNAAPRVDEPLDLLALEELARRAGLVLPDVVDAPAVDSPWSLPV